MTAGRKIKDYISDIKTRVVKQYAPEKIILFGSQAYGAPHPDSDIDMLIIKETPDRPIDRRVQVAKIASDPKRLVPFEPLVLTPAEIRDRMAKGDQFIQEILEKGQVLYDAE